MDSKRVYPRKALTHQVLSNLWPGARFESHPGEEVFCLTPPETQHNAAGKQHRAAAFMLSISISDFRKHCCDYRDLHQPELQHFPMLVPIPLLPGTPCPNALSAFTPSCRLEPSQENLLFLYELSSQHPFKPNHVELAGSPLLLR